MSLTTSAPTQPSKPSTNPGPRTGQTASRAAGTFVAAIGLLVGFQRLGDNSFLTHLETGRLFLSGGFFSTDPYTFTAPPDAPVVVQSWFASLLYAVLFQIGGAVALRVFTALIATAIAAVLWELSRKGETILARLAATLPAVLLGTMVWSERPLLLGLLCFSITLLVVERELPTALLAPTGLLWIWVHGSFPLGIVVLCALAVGSRLDGKDSRRELRALGWLSMGILLGGIANPFGLRLLWFPIALLQRREILSHIAEWRPLNYQSLPAQLFLTGAAVALASLFRTRSFRSSIASLMFFAAAVAGARNIAVASVVFVPVIANGFSNTGTMLSSYRSDRTSMIAFGGGAAIVFIVTASLLQPSWDFRGYPVEAVDFLKTEGIIDGADSARIAHPDRVGNYLELRYDAEVPTFIDDRYELHSAELVDSYLDLFHGTDNWIRVVDEWDIDVVLWRTESPLAERIVADPDWTTAYEDDSWFVSCRNDAC